MLFAKVFINCVESTRMSVTRQLFELTAASHDGLHVGHAVAPMPSQRRSSTKRERKIGKLGTLKTSTVGV
jgi:hypothetical protein